MSRKTKSSGRVGKDRSASRKGKTSPSARRRRERRAIKAQAKQYESRAIVADEKTARKIRAELKRQSAGDCALMMSDVLTGARPILPYLALTKEGRRERIRQILSDGYERTSKRDAIPSGGRLVSSQ